MKDYRDREQQRAAEERWSKSIRQPEQDDIDPRVYGRYDDKAEERKQRDQQYRNGQIIKADRYVLFLVEIKNFYDFVFLIR